MRVATVMKCCVIALMLASAGVAHARYAEHAVYLDLDNNPATGCAATSAAGTIAGAESRVVAVVDGQPASVVSMRRETCVGGTFVLEDSQAASHPVGVGAGVSGSDAVEFMTPLAGITRSNRVAVFAMSTSSEGADLTAAGYLDTLGAGPTPVPTLGPPGAFLLASWVLWLTFRKRKAWAKQVTAAVAVATVATSAWAVTIVLDGLVNDWATVQPLILDSATDATGGDGEVEIVALHATTDATHLGLRLDVVRSALPVLAAGCVYNGPHYNDYTDFGGGWSLEASSPVYADSACSVFTTVWAVRLVYAPAPFDPDTLCQAAFGTNSDGSPLGAIDLYRCL